LRTFKPDGFQDTLIETKDDYIEILEKYFSLGIKDVDKLWTAVIKNNENRSIDS